MSIAATIALSACASGGTPAPATRPMESINFSSALDVNLGRMTKTASGLYYRDLEVGTGSILKGREDIKVHYTGWLTNGTKFDSNGESDAPISIPLGRGRVIKGWDEGLVGMRVGGRRQLVVPPELGYGSNRAGQIPPDAVLVFELKVVSAK
jgi:FKBP-type peptidyl-prolyl cis-trans isomerase